MAFRIGVRAASLCPFRRPLTGLALADPAQQQTVGNRFPGALVLAVAEGSPAAGQLRPGDFIVAVNGNPLSTAPERSDAASANQLSALDQLEGALRNGRASLRVARGREMRTVRLAPAEGCPIRARLARSTQRNAFADGSTVIITTALLDLIRSDDELAVAIGHELAHNLLGHPPQGALSRSATRSAEDAADRLGLRLAWAAGYDPTAASGYWRRVDRGLRLGPSSHPSVREREKMLDEVMAELANEAAQSKVRSDQSSGKARLPSVD